MELNLERTGVFATCVVGMLRSGKNVDRLTLNYNALLRVNSGVERLCVFFSAPNVRQNLRYLELMSCGLKLDDVPPLCSLISSVKHSLVHLKLSDNLFCSASMEKLALCVKGNTCLRQLHFGGNPIGDAGVENISSVLNSTVISDFGLRDVGMGRSIVALCDALCTNTTIRDLQIRGNRCVPCGFEIARVMLRNNTISIIEMQRMGLEDSGVSTILDSVSVDSRSSVTTLHLEGNKIGIRSLRSFIRICSSLTSLRQIFITGPLVSYPSCNDRRWQVLLHASLVLFISVAALALTSLSLSCILFSHDVALSLSYGIASSSCNLVSLNISGSMCYSMRILFDALRHNTSLRHCDFSKNFSYYDGAAACARMISENKTLVHLIVSDNEIGLDGTTLIYDAIKHNRVLTKFVFGGQSSEHPYANVITGAIRRAVASITSRNCMTKRVVEQDCVTTYDSPFLMPTLLPPDLFFF